MAEAAKAVGIADVRIHDLRRTAITRLAQSGASAAIQAFAQHKTLSAAMIYVQQANSTVREARELVDSKTGELEK